MTGLTGDAIGCALGLADCDGDCITTFCVAMPSCLVGVTEGEVAGEALTATFGGVVADAGVFDPSGLPEPVDEKAAFTGVAAGVGGSSYFCSCSRYASAVKKRMSDNHKMYQ